MSEGSVKYAISGKEKELLEQMRVEFVTKFSAVVQFIARRENVGEALFDEGLLAFLELPPPSAVELPKPPETLT